MPRYFFHTFNGSAHPDTEGTELPGLEEAREEAVQTAGEIIQGKASNPGRVPTGTWRSPMPPDRPCSGFASPWRS